MNKNIYTPDLAIITKVRDEAAGIKTFILEFKEPEIQKSFDYRPGQFVELTVFGVGEAPFRLALPR